MGWGGNPELLPWHDIVGDNANDNVVMNIEYNILTSLSIGNLWIFHPWPVLHQKAELRKSPHEHVAPIEQDAAPGVTRHSYLRPLGRMKGGSTAGLVKTP